MIIESWWQKHRKYVAVTGLSVLAVMVGLAIFKPVVFTWAGEALTQSCYSRFSDDAKLISVSILSASVKTVVTVENIRVLMDQTCKAR